MTTDIPVVSRISDEVFSRLKNISNGPRGIQFAGVIRPTKLATYAPEHFLIVLTRGESVRITELDCPGNPPSSAYQQTFMIRVHVAPSERDATPIERYEDIAEGEILRTIRTDATWHTFEDNAINAEFGPVQTVTSDGGYDGIIIPLIVTYRVEEGDPYTVRG